MRAAPIYNNEDHQAGLPSANLMNGQAGNQKERALNPFGFLLKRELMIRINI